MPMGVNKVEYGGETLIDLSKDSVTPETLAEGTTAHDASGEPIVGTMSLNKVTDLKGFTYNIPSGWEAVAGYGKFSVNCDIAYLASNQTRTRFSLGYAASGIGMSPTANYLLADNGSGIGVTNGFSFGNTETFTITFNDGDTTNTSLIDWVTTWGVLQEVECQPKHDENLETLSKEIVGAINEVNKKTVDKIGDIDTYYEDSTDSVGFTDKGIVWTALTDIKLEDKEVTSFTYHRTPIVAGENVTFEVDEENQVVKINATGGGTTDDSTVGTWVFNEELTTPLDVADTPEKLNHWDTEGFYHDLNGYVITPNGNIPIEKIQCVLANGELYGDVYDNVILLSEVNDSIWYVPLDGGWRVTKDYIESNPPSIVITKEPSPEVAEWIRASAKKQSGTSKAEMPQIRFVSMPCDGWFGHMYWEEIDGTQDETYENLKFTIEIVGGGALQVGDAIQLCRMGHYGAWRNKITGKTNPDKRKLRRLFEYVITEEDLEKRFITFEVPWDDKKAIKLFTKWATSGVNDKTIYFRIRRPKGEINSGSNGGGMTVDAEFSNVVSIRCLSYGFTWYAPYDEEIKFYQIRIT